MNSLNTSMLKARYLDCFGARASTGETLRETVKGLFERGVSRKTLITWAMQTGCSKGHAANLLSQILCALGLRARRTGAGPKPSREALELLAYAQAEYGERHVKILRAAWRAAKAPRPGRIPVTTIKVMAPPRLEGAGPYHGSMIRNGVERSPA
jgi:hypothetical protein